MASRKSSAFVERLKPDYKLNRGRIKGGDPFVLFRKWLSEARLSLNPEPNAMVLATASPRGIPSSRMVLLKSFDKRGFSFFTNYESRKAHEIAQNNNAAILFYWGELERQIRIEGKLKRLTRPENEKYFSIRPRGAQLAAWASSQSSVLKNRAELEERLQEMEKAFKKNKKVPCPPFWGGYRLEPLLFEFWSGKPNRLHERILFSLTQDGWQSSLLAP